MSRRESPRPHEHHFTSDMEPVRAPIDPPGTHTIFYMFYCECGLVQIFPPGNYLLTTADYRAQLVRDLDAKGYWLEEGGA